MLPCGREIPKLLWQTIRNFSDPSVINLSKEIRVLLARLQALNLHMHLFSCREHYDKALAFSEEAMDIPDECKYIKGPFIYLSPT